MKKKRLQKIGLSPIEYINIQQFYLLTAVIFPIVFSAMAIIYYKHLSRNLFSNTQILNLDIIKAEVEFHQLLTRKSQALNRDRVKKIAKENLHMIEPPSTEIKMIKL